jgi:hypothetical protein
VKNTVKPIIGVMDDEWTRTLKMLLRLNDNSYNFDDINDNLCHLRQGTRKKRMSKLRI